MYSRLALTFLILSRTVLAFWAGLAIDSHNIDGSCKSQSDWQKAFGDLKQLPQRITSARLYSSYECETLENAVPAALQVGTNLLVGISTSQGQYVQEKQALLDAIEAHGSEWILAVVVGSQTLYNEENVVYPLLEVLYDIKNTLHERGVSAQVGHADAWNVWASSSELIASCDFVGLDIHPYLQGIAISDAADNFWRELESITNIVRSVSNDTWVWVTETGWPVAGLPIQDALASETNARDYWSSVGCALLKYTHFFWYEYQSSSAGTDPDFGLFDKSNTALYDLTAC